MDSCGAPEKRRQIQKMTPARSTKGKSSEEELEPCVQKTKQVEYQIQDGIPGLKMRFGPTNRNVKWTPVIPMQSCFFSN